MSRQDKPNVWIRAKLSYTTDKAVRIKPANQNNLYWLPKSQIVNLVDVLSEIEEGDGQYTDWEVKEWIASKNEIPTVEETGEEDEGLEELDFEDNRIPF